MTACAPLFETRQAEYSHSKQRELNKLKEAYSTFGSMKSIDVVLHIDKSDLSSLVNRSLKKFSKHFAELNAGEFSNVSFDDLELHLNTQQAHSELGFSFYIDALKRNIYGQIKAKHEFNVGRDQFVLSTNFDEIIIDRIENNSALNKNDENRHLISSSVKSFMHTLNKEMSNSPLTIAVDMNILKGVNGKDIVSSPDYKLHSAKPVNIPTKMKVYMPFIYGEGIVLLGASELKNNNEKLYLKEDRTYLWMGLNKKIDLALNEEMGIGLERLENETSYYVRKTYLSKQMNFALKDTDLRSINKSLLQIKDQTFSKDIYFSDEYSLPSCEKVKKDCFESLQICARECDVNYGMHKCEDCSKLNNPFEKVRCISDLEACKSKEELHLYECLKEEDRCRLANTQSDNQCRKDNVERMAQCEEKKERLPFVNDRVQLAELHLKYSVSNSYAIQHIHRIRFDEDLSELEVQRNFHVSVDSSLKFALESAGTEDVNCSLRRESPLFVHSSADRMNTLRRVSVSTKHLSDGAMMIKAISKEKNMPIKLENSPLDRLLESQHFLLSCSYQNMPLTEITVEELLIRDEIIGVISGELSLRFEDEKLSFRVSPIKVGKDLLFYPSMQEKAILFSRKADVD